MTQDIDRGRRRLARLSAVQALYQMEMADHKSKLVVHEFNEHWLKSNAGDGVSKADIPYF